MLSSDVTKAAMNRSGHTTSSKHEQKYQCREKGGLRY